MKPLYHHTSRETAFLVTDYPYGRLRCKIWFWLESDPKKGFRFCSQTENPKNGRINEPKKSTYAKIAACMFLDDKDHCHWLGITEYSDAKEIAHFVENYPGADMTKLRDWIMLKMAYAGKQSKGEIRWSINGTTQPVTEADLKRGETEFLEWQAVHVALKSIMVEKYWMGPGPEKCDICKCLVVSIFVDGATRMGPWANMCLSCHKSQGGGLGLGKGQKYQLVDSEANPKNRRWLKIEG